MSALTDRSDRPVVRAPAPARRPGAGLGARRHVAALAASVAVAAAALPLGSHFSLLGAPIIALVLGAAVATVRPVPAWRGALGAGSRYVLQLAIVVLGATISLPQVLRVGGSSLPVLVGSLTAALLAAQLLGRGLEVPDRLRVLIGVGTGICGASAIAAVSKVVDARERDIRYAISTIFAFNLLAALIFPPLGHLLGMSQHAFGLWAGTAVNDTSSVVATAFAYGHSAGTYAVIVKLTRTAAIVPVSLWLAAAALRRAPQPGEPRLATPRRALRHVVPWFLLWFLAASAINSLVGLDAATRTGLSHAGLALTTLALAAVGLSSNFGELRRTGPRPLALGALVWATVTGVSLALQGL